jgi:hypothetical protein
MREEGRCRGRRRSPVANLLLRQRCRSSGQQLPVVRLRTASATQAASAARRPSATTSVVVALESVGLHQGAERMWQR